MRPSCARACFRLRAWMRARRRTPLTLLPGTNRSCTRRHPGRARSRRRLRARDRGRGWRLVIVSCKSGGGDQNSCIASMQKRHACYAECPDSSAAAVSATVPHCRKAAVADPRHGSSASMGASNGQRIGRFKRRSVRARSACQQAHVERASSRQCPPAEPLRESWRL